MPKSKSSVMKQFRVRVDCEGDELVTQFCKRNCETYIIVHHITTTDNPHYHFYCETHYSQGNFSNKIKEELNVSGGNYSNKSCDPDRRLEYLSYLFNTKKGNVSRLVTYEGFSPLDVETYREQARTIEREFQTKMKDVKKTQMDVVDTVLNRIDSNDLCHTEIVYEHVVATMKEMRIMARPYHVRDIISTIMAYGDNKKAREQIKGLTLKFFSP